MHKSVLKILKRFKILLKINLTQSVKLNGVKLIIPINMGVGYSNLNLSEPWMNELLSALLPVARGSFVDVGVNLGQTLLKLRSLSKEVRYFGFEPNSACISYVRELAALNNFEHISLFPVGLSDENRIVKLNFYHDNYIDSSASVIVGYRPEEVVHRTEFVPVFAWNEIVKCCDFGEIGIVKIDVEGAELEVLSGMKDTLTSKRPFILIEILPVYDLENVSRLERQKELEMILSKAGYSIYRVIKRNNVLISLEGIEQIGVHGDLNNCEYVCCPVEKVSILKQTNLIRLPTTAL